MDRKALTITELLLATIITGVIMMGIVSADYAVRAQGGVYINRALATVNLQAIAPDIIKNASSAVGNKGTGGGNWGIVIDQTDFHFCFHQQNQAGNWVCYSPLLNPSTNLTEIHKCAPASQGPCALTDPSLGNVEYNFSSTNPTFDTTTLVFTLTLKGKNYQTSSSGTGPPIKNNIVTLKISVMPAGQSNG